MRELISLIKVNLNVNFGISMFKYKVFKQKKNLWQPILFIIAMLSLIPTYILYIGAVKGFYRGFEYINQGGLVLLLGFLFTQLIIFIFGILYIMGKFYFSDDLKILIPLPLKANKILIGKFITLLINEYITVLPFILPVFFIYGLDTSQGPLYWIYSLIVFIVLPIIPLGLSTILVMLFMKVTNIKGKKDLLRVIGFIVMIVVILAMQFGIQSMANNVEEGHGQDYIAQIAAQNDVLIKKMGTAFPPSIWASLALTDSSNINGFLNLVFLVGVSCLVFVLMVLVGEKVFYEGIIGGQETVAKKRKVTDVELKRKASRTSHPIIAILKRDMKILIRTPIFAMNSVGSVIIFPIALGMPLIINNGSIDVLKNFYTNENMTFVNLILLGFIIFIGAINGVACTTFSREGRRFWISRVIPIKVEDYLLGKILSGLLVQFLAVLVILIPLSFIVRLHISTILTVLILGILGSIPIIELGMLIDIIRPLLDWDNPQKAMKQNLNVLFAMLLGFVFILLLGFIVFLLFSINLQSILIYIIMATILVGLSIALFFILAPMTANRLKNIE